MNSQYRELARSAKKINGEKRFVVDLAYHIKKPTRCEICGDIIHNGIFTRAWFEISRQVYPDCISGNRKGITICNRHDRKVVVEYLEEFFNDKISSDVRLKNCKKWSVYNAYENHDKSVLENIINKDLLKFRSFVLEDINGRYKCNPEKLKINRKVVDEIERQYEDILSSREFTNLTDKELKRRLEDIEDMLLSTIKKSNRKKNTASLDNWKKRIGEYIQDLAVSRFLYNGEISNSSYFRKRLNNYAGKWNEKKFLAVRKVAKKEAEKIREKNSLRHKVKIANVLSDTLKDNVNKLSDLLEEIKGMIGESDA